MARELTIGESEPAYLNIRGERYPVRYGTDLDVDVLAEAMEIENLRRRASRNPNKYLPEFIVRAKALVMKVIREQTPDAPDLSLNGNELTQILNFLGPAEQTNGAATAEVAATLADGHPSAGDEGMGERASPTTSRPRSRKRSQRSGRSTSGSPDGGEGSDGASSDSTFASSTSS